MSDSEQRQLHVPYREYHSQNNTSPATLVETDALVDLTIAPSSRLSQSDHQPPVAIATDLLPDVEFIPSLSNDQTLAIDSSGIDRESQPLLGRLELDVTFNRFSGVYLCIESCLAFLRVVEMLKLLTIQNVVYCNDIHYLVTSYIEKKYLKINKWIPSRY